MRTTITDYAIREAFSFAQIPPSDEYDPRDIDFLLDQLLANIPEDSSFPDNFIIKIKGQPITPEDAFGMIATQLPRLRMEAIYLFEEYFKKGTDPEKFISDYESGDADARRAFRHMGIFPVEAINVRTELAFPKLMSMRAAQSEENRTMLVLQQILGPIKFTEIQGPHLPPLSASAVVEQLKTSIPDLDKRTREIIAGGTEPAVPKSTPMN